MGGFYHDGRFATLAAVIEHYDVTLRLGLTNQGISELIEYQRSLKKGRDLQRKSSLGRAVVISQSVSALPQPRAPAWPCRG